MLFIIRMVFMFLRVILVFLSVKWLYFKVCVMRGLSICLSFFCCMVNLRCFGLVLFEVRKGSMILVLFIEFNLIFVVFVVFWSCCMMIGLLLILRLWVCWKWFLKWFISKLLILFLLRKVFFCVECIWKILFVYFSIV